MQFLRRCLASIRETCDTLNPEVIVVDNASTDGSADMVADEFPEAILVRAEENLGFARANNVGIACAAGRFIALVNSDVVVHSGCIAALLTYLEQHPEVGLAGPKILGIDGRLQHSFGRLPTVWNTACRLFGLDRVLSRWQVFSGFQMRHLTGDVTAEVEVLSGCFWLARRDAIRDVGGLDEQFFFYAEDVDWCKRFAGNGWKIVYVSEAVSTHFGGGSSSIAPLRYSIEMLRSNMKYWRKHHGHLGQYAFQTLVLFRFLLRLVANGSRRVVVGPDPVTVGKLKEDLACIRWLATGRGVQG